MTETPATQPEIPSQPAPPAKAGWSTRKKAAVIVGVIVVALLVYGVLRGPAPTTPGTAQPTQRPPGATSRPAATAAGPAAFADIQLSGTGSRVERFTIPASESAIAKLNHRGSSNFAVWTVSPEGTEQDLLVNTIGAYAGTVLFDESGHSAALKIEADGAWTITIQHPSKARTWNPSAAVSGQGDDVVRLSPAASGLVTMDLSHSGESNFAIWAYGGSGGNLLVNEIGRHSGQVLIPPGTAFLEVQADGAWSATP